MSLVKIHETLEKIVDKVSIRQDEVAPEDLESLQQLGVITDILIKIGKYLDGREKQNAFKDVNELEEDI